VVHLKDDLVFLWSPVALLYVRVQDVVPALSTLLTAAAQDFLGTASPLISSVRFNPLLQLFVFGKTPRAFDKAWAKNLAPSMQTLNRSATRDMMRH
jgi:hypothetical protein